MTDTHAKWARVLVHYSTAVQPGDQVFITGGVVAEPLLRAIYRETVLAGANPILLPLFPEWSSDFLAHADDDQLAWISPIDASHVPKPTS